MVVDSEIESPKNTLKRNRGGKKRGYIQADRREGIAMKNSATIRGSVGD